MRHRVGFCLFVFLIVCLLQIKSRRDGVVVSRVIEREIHKERKKQQISRKQHRQQHRLEVFVLFCQHITTQKEKKIK